MQPVAYLIWPHTVASYPGSLLVTTFGMKQVLQVLVSGEVVTSKESGYEASHTGDPSECVNYKGSLGTYMCVAVTQC